MSKRDSTADLLGPLVSPWPVLGIGFALIGVGFMWGMALPSVLPALRALILGLGLIAIGSALLLHIPHAPKSLEGRLLCGAMCGLLSLASFLASLGLSRYFDSMQVLLQFLIFAAAIGGILFAVPPAWRMLGASVIIALHFAAILTAVTVVPPPEGPAPYVSNHLWNRAARPWLQLTLLNNGYHFYSPDPGPSQLMWFYAEFEDGAATWMRIPDHNKVSSHIERRRLGALATSSAASNPVQPDHLDKLRLERIRGGQNFKGPNGKLQPIPMSDMPLGMQYREAAPYAKQLVAAMARHVARTAQHPDGETVAVSKVKVYRVDYMNPTVMRFQAGQVPLDPTLYLVYFMGEHDPNGKLTEKSFKRVEKDGRFTVEQDPFLYWQLPIVRQLEVQQEGLTDDPRRMPGPAAAWTGEGKVINYVRIHAGDKFDQESIP